MAFEPYHDRALFKVHETSELVDMGGFQVAFHQQLGFVVCRIYKHGTPVGAERFRLKLFTDAGLTKAYAQSAWLELADVVAGASDWLGRVRFSFADPDDMGVAAGPHLNKNAVYYAGIEADGYTRSGGTFYVAWAYDWPEPINSHPVRTGMEMAIYGYRT